MEQLTLNFFGEEAKIEYPSNLQTLRAQISEKYLLSPSDSNEIILYYVQDNQKHYIINGTDFSKFKDTKVNILFLDVNQNSKLYLDNASKLSEEKSQSEKDQKELNELLDKYKIFSEKKKEKEVMFYKMENEIMNEIKKKRAELLKNRQKEFSKVYEKDEEFITKIYNLQKKLSIPTTVRIPMAIKKEEEERKYKEEKRKKEEMMKQYKLRKVEELKKKRERRIKYEEEIKKRKEEDEKKKSIARLNLLKSTQRNINCRQDFFPHMSLRKSEEEKRMQAYRCRTIAASTAATFFSSRKNQNSNNNEEKKELLLSNEIVGKKAEENELNTVPVFNKVNEILSHTVEQVKNVAKEHIKKEETEEEKKVQIEQIKKITKEAIKEINNLTKLVIEQSNALIEKISNNNSFKDKDNDVILFKEFKKEQEEQKEQKEKKEPIHFNILCDGCKMNPIRGNRYKCIDCPDFDFCENCYQKNKDSHGHEFKKIEKLSFTNIFEYKNNDYNKRENVHMGVKCNRCGSNPIIGWRFKCSICENYNLCEKCEENSGYEHGHPLIKIYNSKMQKKFDDYYLKLNNYEEK